MAACEAPSISLGSGGPPTPYGDKVMFIANDWHTSLLPLYLENRFKTVGRLKDSKSILVIHNMAHQVRVLLLAGEQCGREE